MKILRLHLIDPVEASRAGLVYDCEGFGWQVKSFSSITEFLEARQLKDAMLLILSLPKGFNAEADGKDLSRLRAWREQHNQIQLMLLLPEGFPAADRLALELDARHILFKPYRNEDLAKILVNTATGVAERTRNKALKSRASQPEGFETIIGVSPAIREVLELAKRVAESDCTSVMITGECGTGKGALAKAIHLASDRSSGPFIEVNCAAIPRTLLESEFFGHERGAFTDAKEEKMGLFECANEGTIFLDEVGEIDYGLQAKLLKFLDTRLIRRISGTQFMPVDVRVISATNRDLNEAIAQKRFRSDLFYRLNVVDIYIPPLRERTEDIRAIAEVYAARFASRLNKGTLRLSEAAIVLLEGYSWPGNVRELINIIERAVLLNHSGTITPSELPLKEEVPETKINVTKQEGTIRIDLPPEGASLEEVEKGLITTVLEQTGGNITQAACRLKVGRGTLRYKLKKYGMDTKEIKKNIKNGRFEPVGVTDC
ncbi:MAG: sigma-54-dependent Fis family transcriptional regulator [bacterium]|nr:MAG: sigma-54-dependent Fis family transcriptional regulator [bacterium]